MIVVLYDRFAAVVDAGNGKLLPSARAILTRRLGTAASIVPTGPLMCAHLSGPCVAPLGQAYARLNVRVCVHY